MIRFFILCICILNMGARSLWCHIANCQNATTQSNAPIGEKQSQYFHKWLSIGVLKREKDRMNASDRTKPKWMQKYKVENWILNKLIARPIISNCHFVYHTHAIEHGMCFRSRDATNLCRSIQLCWFFSAFQMKLYWLECFFFPGFACGNLFALRHNSGVFWRMNSTLHMK